VIIAEAFIALVPVVKSRTKVFMPRLYPVASEYARTRGWEERGERKEQRGGRKEERGIEPKDVTSSLEGGPTT
ncbi:MAG: hypothetical protein ACTHQE_06660, partial [Thermomicrobiales bacterium]